MTCLHPGTDEPPCNYTANDNSTTTQHPSRRAGTSNRDSQANPLLVGEKELSMQDPSIKESKAACGDSTFSALDNETCIEDTGSPLSTRIAKDEPSEIDDTQSAVALSDSDVSQYRALVEDDSMSIVSITASTRDLRDASMVDNVYIGIRALESVWQQQCDCSLSILAIALQYSYSYCPIR